MPIDKRPRLKDHATVSPPGPGLLSLLLSSPISPPAASHRLRPVSISFDRVFWVGLSLIWNGWRAALRYVQ